MQTSRICIWAILQPSLTVTQEGCVNLDNPHSHGNHKIVPGVARSLVIQWLQRFLGSPRTCATQAVNVGRCGWHCTTGQAPACCLCWGCFLRGRRRAINPLVQEILTYLASHAVPLFIRGKIFYFRALEL